MKKLRRSRATFAAVTLGTAVLTAGATGPASSEEAAPAAPPATGAYLAPYYTEGDLTGDRQIDGDDLDLLVKALGTVQDDAGWAAVAAADYDADGAIEMTDVADLSRRMMYDDGPFDLIEASAVEMQKAMNAGVTTSVALTQAYLDRIAAYDGLVDATHSNALNSIVTTGGAKALAAAAASDAAREAHGGPSGMLDGIPVLLKDNYDTKDMPTSAGTGGWKNNQTADDAFMVDGLRDAGAIILGKASLDEFALGFASEFSTNSPAGSSLLVKSPYVLSRTAGGSSGGTGASIAANLGAIGFGTDTGGSIRVPSSYNQLVGIRPTVGLASRDGIVPLALSQDTGGPIARSVSDAAVALDAVVGTDPKDPITSEQAGKVPTSYTAALDPDALRGKRIGYVTSMVGSNATTVRLFDQAVADLTAQGATVVPITTSTLNATLSEPSGSTNEFKHDLDLYVQQHLDPTVAQRDLTSLVAGGQMVPGRSSTYVGRNNVTPTQYDTWMGTHTAAIATGETAVNSLLAANGVDALMYPSGTPYGTQGSNMRLSPNTGMPAISVPMGQASSSESIPGAGVNLELLGPSYSESMLIGLAYDYEQATHHRTTPALFPALSTPAKTRTPAVSRARGGFSMAASASEVAVGEQVTVTVSADNVADLYAYDLGLRYDPAVLKVVPGSATTDLSGSTYGLDQDGTLDVVHTKLGSSPSASGPARLASVTFTAVAAGSVDVRATGLESIATDLSSRTISGIGGAVVTSALKAAPTATTAPVLSGRAKVGRTLSVSGGSWDVDGVAVSYQWRRGGIPIAGATGSSYDVVPADAGEQLDVVVSAARPTYVTGTATAAAGVVARAGTTTKVVIPGGVERGERARARITVGAGPGVVPTGRVKVTYAGKVLARRLVLREGRATLRLPAKRAGRYDLRVVLRPGRGFTTSSRTMRVRVG